MATYPASIRFLYGLQWSGMKFGLRNINRLVSSLGHPERAYRTIHVAGSNGKGTTAALIASVLTAAGYRTGLYSSPHVLDFTERIRVDGKPIPRSEFTKILEALRPEIVRTRATFFEAATAIAFEHFRRAKVDVAVLEVGLGGRLDATNVVRPILSVITSISREHEAILGRGLARIAREKGGIIKRRVPVCVGDVGPRPARVLSQIARRKHAPYVDLRGVRTRVLAESTGGTRFQVQGTESLDGEFRVPLVGRRQLRNAALAARALAEVKQREKFAVGRQALERGFAHCRKLAGLGARFELLKGRPPVIIDVAHNSAAIRSVVLTLERLSIGKPTVVLGLMKDKDLDGISRWIGRVASHVVAVEPRTERARSSAALAEHFRKRGIPSSDGGAVSSGMRLARRITRGGVILVTGSHFVVGEMLAARLHKNYLTINQ